MKKKAIIIGYGGMGKWHHDALSATGLIDVIGAFDIRKEVREEIEQKMTIYASFEEVLASEADLIIIATPNDSHKAYALAGLKSGKHVVCEKPVTLTSKDLLEIEEQARCSDKIFTIHQNRRWDTDFRIVKKILSDNLIGQPYFIESRVNGSSVFLHGWRDFKINGGGMLYDWGVHLIDQILQLTSAKLTGVTAHIRNVFSEEVDDNVKLFLEFSDGLSVVLEVATNCFIPFPRWHLSGKSGTAIIENWDCDGKIVHLVEGDTPTWASEIVYTAAGPTRTMAPRAKSTIQEQSLPELEDSKQMKQTKFYSAEKFYGNLVKVMDGEEEAIVKISEALKVLKVIEAAFLSAEKKQTIAVDF